MLAGSWRIRVPKIKTHRGAAKRFKKTVSGKFKRGHAFARHILTSKDRKRKLKLGKNTTADKSDQGRLDMMLPYA